MDWETEKSVWDEPPTDAQIDYLERLERDEYVATGGGGEFVFNPPESKGEASERIRDLGG